MILTSISESLFDSQGDSLVSYNTPFKTAIQLTSAVPIDIVLFSFLTDFENMSNIHIVIPIYLLTMHLY